MLCTRWRTHRRAHAVTRLEQPRNARNSPRFDGTSTAILDAAAHVFAEEGTGANLASVAAVAGISRATLYRYYANREALLNALAVAALDVAAQRIADAALERATVEDAIERTVRAFVAVGDRYAVLAGDHTVLKTVDERFSKPIQDVLSRGVETGVLRADLTVPVLYEFLTGAVLRAIKLNQRHDLGLEEASAAAAGFFLGGARAPH
ncbi:TetR/AcrR family transcriptional regulator [Amycolatopsis jiangsuensis]|uniref:AcrR family transcriptional regulator n=1 Tax=Amycolatopsis jiangsuensis TaxID=1181879 RepID=A0A840IX53_9PSEU|nr:TetR/AcrR family transcriptional regulator [Amycolatopsis jiangsuensis]MBB4686005.1 AcrR family transcriptional regulator [Amycolatopsis jiangsuensis]